MPLLMPPLRRIAALGVALAALATAAPSQATARTLAVGASESASVRAVAWEGAEIGRAHV